VQDFRLYPSKNDLNLNWFAQHKSTLRPKFGWGTRRDGFYLFFVKKKKKKRSSEAVTFNK